MRFGNLISMPTPLIPRTTLPTTEATPEEIFANDEVVGWFKTALREAKPEDREAFILFTLEGFTIRELSAITERSEEDVRKSIRAASEVLKRGMPVSDPLKSRMVERAKIA